MIWKKCNYAIAAVDRFDLQVPAVYSSESAPERSGHPDLTSMGAGERRVFSVTKQSFEKPYESATHSLTSLSSV